MQELNNRPTKSASAWFLVGPTATGKTSVAHALARRHGFEILSADAMQVYRGMDIGTAKPTSEERDGIVYHGIDLVEPDEEFSVGSFLRAIAAVISSEAALNGKLIVAGGTGLYIQALTQGLDAKTDPDPEQRAFWNEVLKSRGLQALREELEKLSPGILNRIPDSRNPRRLIRLLEQLEQGSDPTQYKSWLSDKTEKTSPVAALHFDPVLLADRIEKRIHQMFKAGFTEEVKGLLSRYPVWSKTAAAAIGYREVRAILEGHLPEEDAITQIAIRTRQLAKRQRTWFRNRTPSLWLDGPESEKDIKAVADSVERHWEKYGPSRLVI